LAAGVKRGAFEITVMTIGKGYFTLPASFLARHIHTVLLTRLYSQNRVQQADEIPDGFPIPSDPKTPLGGFVILKKIFCN